MNLQQYRQKYLKSAYVLVFLIFFLPRVIGLGADIANYDSSYWHPRTEEFTKHLLRGNYKQTYQKYHPGVTLLWLSGSSKYAFEQAFELKNNFSPRYIPQQFTRLHFATKIPLVLLISFIGVALYVLLSKITNKTFALIFAIVLSIEPFFLGVSKFLHLSALTSMFMFLSFLLLFYYYYSKKSQRWLFYLSAITLGLGLLTKIDAAIAGVVNALLLVYFELFEARVKDKSIFKSIYKSLFNSIVPILKNGLIYAIIVFFIFYILFPSMWVAPHWTINKIISEGIGDTAFSSSGADTLSGIKALFYPEMIVFRSLPTYSIGFATGLILFFYYLITKKSNQVNKNKAFYGWVFIYIVLNIAFLTIPDKIKDRYVINLYPALSVFVAFLIYLAYQSKHKLYKYGVIGIFVFFYLLTIYKYHPVYSFYYSELVGGAAGREKMGLKVKNRGEFYAQAAQHINKIDKNAVERNVIISHREQLRTFPQFFYGKTYATPGLLPDDHYADYIIIRPDFLYLLPKDNCTLEKEFGPKEPIGYTTLYLYKCEGIDNNYKDFRN